MRIAVAALVALVLAPASAQAATVTTMVVGRDQAVLRDAKEVKISKASRQVKVGSRRCAVAGNTPLGVLTRLSLAFKLRDYGSCNKKAKNAGGLFVRRLGPDRNRGQNGWVYKVGRRAGSNGAADTAGPFGNGRLRDGDTVLWFFCRQGAKGCQRTLEAKPDRASAAVGETLRVTVRAYDDQGKGAAAAGVAVHLGTASAVTGADGVALVPVTEAGTLDAGGRQGRHGPLLPARGARQVRRALALLICLGLLGGCGFGPGKSTSASGSLTVTRDFGDVSLGKHSIKSLSDSETVMRRLQKEFEVKTRYGGGFVQEIDGVAGGREDGRQVDWFYYVNGIEASNGAAERKLQTGDRVWWDHHDWDATMRVPAVVGSFPEPFVSGSEGRKLPVRLVCLKAEEACDEVETRLQDAGIDDIGRSVLAQSAGREVLRVLVGPWSELRKDTAARKLESGPEESGVYAMPDKSGRRIDLLDEKGDDSRVLGPGGGLLAATRIEAQQPTWVVTGVDETGVAAAAAALTETELRDHFAIAVEEGRAVSLPIVEQQP